MTIRKSLLAGVAVAAFCLAMPEAGAQRTVAFGYANNDELTEWGTGRAEHYDVAVALTDPELVGKTIKGVKIPVVEFWGNTDWNVWITTKLKLKTQDGKRVNNANVCSMDVTPADGMIEVDFKTPYTITAEGAYVGYGFMANNSEPECRKPLKLSREAQPGAFHIRTSNALTMWVEKSEDVGRTLAMQVMLEGDFPEASLELERFNYSDATADAVPTASVEVMNRCGNVIRSVDYEYTINGTVYKGHYDLPLPIAAQWGRRASLHLPLHSLDRGAYSVNLEITKVNGLDNASTNRSAENTVDVHNIMPRKRVLMEEYTGVWCGWCPRGMVALEMMKQRHPDFICIAYHGGNDPMTMAKGSPDMATGYPRGFIDRVIETDPYMGTAKINFGIEQDWLARSQEFTPVSIKAEADWDKTNNRIVHVTSETEWLRLPEDADVENYRLEYVLLGDDLHGSSSEWTQVNYYANDSSFANDHNLDAFTGAGTTQVKGLHFNDVALATSGGFGIKGSITEIVPDELYTHGFDFDITEAVNSQGIRMVQDRTKLKVVVMLLYVGKRSEGEVVNAALAYLPDYSAVEEIEAARGEVASTMWYDLQGRRADNATNIPAIKVTVFTDGTVKTEKTIKR